MKRFLFFGFLSAAVLALFLLLRPVVAAAGTPAVPDTAGRARELLPEERTGGVKGAATTTSAPVPKTAGSPLQPAEEQIVALANEMRRAAGLPPLAVADFLHRAARAHARDMIERGFTDTINPDGLTADDRVSREDRRAVAVVGETIASATAKDADMARTIVAGWMGNPTDREKLVRPEYAQIGVGVVPGGPDVRAVAVLAHTVALTEAPIPERIAAGGRIRVVVASGDPTARCSAVDLFSPGTGLAVAGPSPLGEMPMNVAPGQYRLRFHCGAGTARIVPGPRIEVTP